MFGLNLDRVFSSVRPHLPEQEGFAVCSHVMKNQAVWIIGLLVIFRLILKFSFKKISTLIFLSRTGPVGNCF